MTKKKIYLSGAISGIPEEEAMKWREEIEKYIILHYYDISMDVFNPVSHFTLDSVKSGEVTDREIMLIELNNLKNSDAVFFNCHHPESLGSMAELAIAYDRGIPIFGFNESSISLHPWIKNMCTKIFVNSEKMVDFYIDHYL